MAEHEYGRSPLRAALEELMNEINPSEILDSELIVGQGRRRRHRKRLGIVAGGTLAVLATAGTGYALSAGAHGKTSVPTAGQTVASASAAAKASSASPAAPHTADSALPGTPLTSGTTDGVAWKTSVTFVDYQGGPDQQGCVHVWTSDGSTKPAACTVTVYPGYAGGGTTPQVMSTQPMAISAKLGVAGMATAFTTEVRIAYAGGSFTLPTVSAGRHPGQNNEVTAVVLPLADTAPSGTVTPIGPAGTGMTSDILIYAPLTTK